MRAQRAVRAGAGPGMAPGPRAGQASAAGRGARAAGFRRRMILPPVAGTPEIAVRCRPATAAPPCAGFGGRARGQGSQRAARRLPLPDNP